MLTRWNKKFVHGIIQFNNLGWQYSVLYVFNIHQYHSAEDLWEETYWSLVHGSYTLILASKFPTVDADEIRRLGKRFRKLDLDNSGSLSVEEFMSLPELQQNPLVQRVIDIFDADGNGEVDFKGKEEMTADCHRGDC